MHVFNNGHYWRDVWNVLIKIKVSREKKVNFLTGWEIKIKKDFYLWRNVITQDMKTIV